MNEFDYSISCMKEKGTKDNDKNIINQIKINCYFIFCFLCFKKRKNKKNFLLDEAIKVILTKLDIMNIFKNYSQMKNFKTILKNKILQKCLMNVKNIQKI